MHERDKTKPISLVVLWLRKDKVGTIHIVSTVPWGEGSAKVLHTIFMELYWLQGILLVYVRLRNKCLPTASFKPTYTFNSHAFLKKAKYFEIRLF